MKVKEIKARIISGDVETDRIVERKAHAKGDRDRACFLERDESRKGVHLLPTIYLVFNPE